MSFKTIFPVWDIFAVCWAWQISSYMLQNEGRRALIRRSSNPFDHHQAILLTRPSLHQQLASSSTIFLCLILHFEWPMIFWSIVRLRVIGVIFLYWIVFPDIARICFLPLVGDQFRDAPNEEMRCLIVQIAFCHYPFWQALESKENIAKDHL